MTHHRAKSHALFGAALIALAMRAPLAGATVVNALTLEEKIDRSPVIVHATVDRVDTDWLVEGERIETRITIAVVECLKGDIASGKRIAVIQGGGTIGSTTNLIPGTHTYEPGDEVVLFLEPLGADFVTIGIGIGTYGVVTEGKTRVIAHAPSVAEARHTTEGRFEIGRATPLEPITLARFLHRIRSRIIDRPISKNR